MTLDDESNEHSELEELFNQGVTMAESNAPTDTPNNVTVDDVTNAMNEALAAVGTVKLPQFWPDKIRLWFVQVDAQFTIKKITVEQTKFAHAVTMLDSATAEHVMDILTNPPA